MAGFNLGSLLGGIVPGLEHGLQQGLQYDVTFARMYLHALTSGNAQEQADLKAVLQQWLKEAADEAGVVRGDVVKTLEGGGDPFAGSRHLLQAAEAKYGTG